MFFSSTTRVGELIESGGISGTVETFSLRSVKLRQYKGRCTCCSATWKAITNYSRDFVNELMGGMTVVCEADLERVERAIEQVNNKKVIQDLQHLARQRDHYCAGVDRRDRVGD